ncbi:MAG: hypothetical protein JSS02_12335 [Planctomycetes bacterium]|nr:hypothetical protein [Planctomycetota bacterium]
MPCSPVRSALSFPKGILFAGLLILSISPAGFAHLKLEKSAAPQDDATESSTDDDLDSAIDLSHEVDQDLTALTVPGELLGKIDAAKRLQYSQSLRALLLEGISPAGAAVAKRHFEAAHRAIPSDPRATYAYGLALLEQQNSKEALSQFQAAAKQSPGPYLPARQAMIWTLLVRQDCGAALPQLLELARQIERVQGSWPTERDRRHSAEWLGRTMGFLSGPGSIPDLASRITETTKEIEGTLTGERLQAFRRANKGIPKRQQELEDWARRPVDELTREMNSKRQDARLGVQAAEAEMKRLQEEIRDAKRPFDQRIADSKKDLRSYSQQAKQATKDIPALEEQVATLSVPQQKPNGYNTYRGRPTSMRWRNENAQEKKARESQLSSAQQKLQQAKTAVTRAKQGLADSRKEQEQAQSDMRKTIGPKQHELAEARRTHQEATSRLREVEHAILSPEQMKSRPKALEAYVPLDILAEKDRLLATIR